MADWGQRFHAKGFARSWREFGARVRCAEVFYVVPFSKL
ncbi:hypothetical protein Z949_2698 [Sulfitobacter guttiformis KCTC 32187]|nr:hypothetical protein Z949_2698 [Sulfitobacter guttiformis KCTC 32187]